MDLFEIISECCANHLYVYTHGSMKEVQSHIPDKYPYLHVSTPTVHVSDATCLHRHVASGAIPKLAPSVRKPAARRPAAQMLTSIHDRKAGGMQPPSSDDDSDDSDPVDDKDEDEPADGECMFCTSLENRKGNSILLCDGKDGDGKACANSSHQLCLDPPLAEVPNPNPYHI